MSAGGANNFRIRDLQTVLRGITKVAQSQNIDPAKCAVSIVPYGEDIVKNAQKIVSNRFHYTFTVYTLETLYLFSG